MASTNAGVLTSIRENLSVLTSRAGFTLGNPLIAWTMMKYDLGVGLNVPIRLMIYEDSAKKVRLVYDLPSSLMSRLGNEELTPSFRANTDDNRCA